MILEVTRAGTRSQEPRVRIINLSVAPGSAVAATEIVQTTIDSPDSDSPDVDSTDSLSIYHLLRVSVEGCSAEVKILKR